MRIHQRIKADMQKVVDVSGLENLKIMYRHKGNTRLAWDVFWASPNSNTHAATLYELGFDDPQFETLLSNICKELDLITNSKWIELPQYAA